MPGLLEGTSEHAVTAACNVQAEPANTPPFDMSFMAEFVDELSSFDRRMNTAVIDSGILAHVPTNALAKQGLPTWPSVSR